MTESRLQFHISEDDYFGTLATVLDLLRQEMERRGRRKKHAEIIRRVTADLGVFAAEF